MKELDPEVQEFLKLYENFPKLLAVCAQYMKEECREKVNVMDRLTEAAFWFKAYWDFIHVPELEGAKAVIRDKKTGNIIGVQEYGTQKGREEQTKN